MPGFIIIAHAPLASALKAVVAHAVPDCLQTVEVLDVPSEMPPEQIEAGLRELLARMTEPDTLIFADVFGATPFNVAQRVVDGVHVRLIAGVNVPMLFASLRHAGEPLDKLVTRAEFGAVKGVLQGTISRPQNQNFNPGRNDQDPHHDQ